MLESNIEYYVLEDIREIFIPRFSVGKSLHSLLCFARFLRVLRSTSTSFHQVFGLYSFSKNVTCVFLGALFLSHNGAYSLGRFHDTGLRQVRKAIILYVAPLRFLLSEGYQYSFLSPGTSFDYQSASLLFLMILRTLNFNIMNMTKNLYPKLPLKQFQTYRK